MVHPTTREAPLQWGMLNLRPHILYQFLYGDGIQTKPGEQTTTAINAISPGLLLGLGRHVTLDYTPTWRFYSSREFQDSLDHNVVLTYGAAYEDWVLGLSQGYISSSAPRVETGTQTTEESYLTALTASYRFNSKMSMDLTINQSFTSSEGSATNAVLTGNREWSTLDWLNYQFWSRLDVGIGAGVGYSDVDIGPDATYERLEGRISWRATDKLSLLMHGGVEDRQFLSGAAGNLINPIVGASVAYQPFETTILTLNVNRTVNTSVLANQSTEITSFGGSLSQRLLKRLHLNLGGGYNRTQYVSSEMGASVIRKDDYYFFNTRLSWTILKRGTISLTYQFSDNSSSDKDLTFSSNQIGVELGFRY
jgi:hypothetical protein